MGEIDISRGGGRRGCGRGCNWGSEPVRAPCGAQNVDFIFCRATSIEDDTDMSDHIYEISDTVANSSVANGPEKVLCHGVCYGGARSWRGDGDAAAGAPDYSLKKHGIFIKGYDIALGRGEFCGE